jgi:tetratricopeptide (TPR) repeat protein
MVLGFAFLTAGCDRHDGASPGTWYRQGSAMLNAGNRSGAYRSFARAAHAEPGNTVYQWAAAQTAPNARFALLHVKTAWDNGLRNFKTLEAYSMLSSFSRPSEGLQFTMQLYEQLPDSARREELRAEIFSRFNQYDSSLAIWRRLFNAHPSAALCNRMAQAFFSTNDAARAESLLVTSRNRRLLDQEGYILLALAKMHGFDYPEVEAVFDSAEKNGCYRDAARLAHARLLIAREQLPEALRLLSTLGRRPASGEAAANSRQIRIAQAYIHFLQKEPQALDSLNRSGSGEPVLPGERKFYELLIRRLSDSADLFPLFQEAVKDMPRYPEIGLVLAREAGLSGRHAEALEMYRQLPDAYLSSPRVMVERAALLAALGKEEDAVSVLAVMHSRNISTRSSLELLRDISIRQNRMDEAWRAQNVLAGRFGQNPEVRWVGGMLALKSGRLDSALSVFTALSRDFPGEERFNVQRISVLFLKKEYQTVITECEKAGAAAMEILRLQARSSEKLGMTDRADSLYRTALALRKNPALKTEYAGFLLDHDHPALAAALYQEVIDTDRDAFGKDSAAYAALLNNLAWALLQAGSVDRNKVLGTIAAAHSLDSKNGRIVDTHARALIHFRKYRECIKVLDRSNGLQPKASLLVRRAEAYEKMGDLNNSVRALRDAQKCKDAAGVDTAAVRSKIQTIMARING